MPPLTDPDLPVRRALSLGAGVQSTTVFLMSLRGELPRFDVAIFADTGAEPAEVYDHLAKLIDVGKAEGLPVVMVKAEGDLTGRMLDPSRRDGIQIPAFIKGEDGRRNGILRRQCTERFKSRPVYKYLGQWRERALVEQTLGISWDEVGRIKPAQRKWVTNCYPLVDRRITRAACHEWLAGAGWTAPRSACTYCPYHSDAEWRRLRDEHPADFAQAVEIDRGMRSTHAERMARGTTSLTGTPFVHRSLLPLDEVDFRTVEERGQGSIFDGDFGDECEGLCGI